MEICFTIANTSKDYIEYTLQLQGINLTTVKQTPKVTNNDNNFAHLWAHEDNIDLYFCKPLVALQEA